MGDRIKTNLDEDIHEFVNQRHTRTGKSKSQIVNELAREGYEGSENTVPGFQSLLGQSLFVAGPIVALLAQMAPGIGMMVLGLGLLLYGSMQTHMARGESAGQALKATLLH